MRSKSVLCLFSIAILLPLLHSLHAQRLNHVIEFMPAPGQFINTLPIYEAGDDSLAILAKADALIANNGLLSLGAFGGYVIFACPQGITNVTGEYDFRVLGNAFNNNSEPGVIMVMKDVNGNGLPDDEWYDIWGSEHDDENSNLHYQITYYKPTVEKEAEQAPTDYILWRDNEGNSGYVSKNRFHAQSYWPGWINSDSLVFSSTRLRDNAQDVNGDGSYIMFESFDYGYADNVANNIEGSKIKIDWASSKDGELAYLDTIHFVKIATGVNNCYANTGEISTEVGGLELMSHTTSLDNTLQDQGDVYIVKEQLFIRGLENSRAQIFNITGACVGAYDIKSEQEILNVNHLSVGLYIIQIKINNHTNYFKIIKTKD